MQKNQNKKIYSNNLAKTGAIAKDLLDLILEKQEKDVTRAVVIGLSGNLGAGKTAFTQALARHLGVKAKVNSPTFVIMKKYPVKFLGYKYLYHFDAYRLEHEKELLNLKWEEIISDKEHIVIVEWPENVSSVMPNHAHMISIEIGEGTERVFTLE